MSEIRSALRHVTVRVCAFAVLLTTIGVGLAFFAVDRAPVLVIHVPYGFLFAGYLFAGTAPLLLEVESNSFSLSLTEIPLVLGLLGSARPTLMAAGGAGWFVSRIFDRRRSILKLAFNVPLTFLEITVAAAVFDAVAGSARLDQWETWLRLLAALAVAIVISTTAVNVVIVVAGDSMTWRRAVRHSVLGLINAVMATALTVLSVIAMADTKAAIIPLLLLGTVAIIPMRRLAKLQRRHDSLLLLHEFTQGLTTSQDLSLTLHSVLTETARVLRTADATIVLPLAEQIYNSLHGDENAVVPRIDDPLWREVIDERRGVCLERGSTRFDSYLANHGLKDLMVVPLLHADDIVGVLTVRNRLGDVSTFDRDDLSIFSTMANQTTVTLENLRLIDRLRTESAQREHQAFHDELTGLPNRAHLYRMLDHELARGNRTLAVAVLDLNRFKEVNDTLGHHAGDEVLIQTAQRLRHALPASAFVARLGGDEFAIVIHAVTNTTQAVERMSALTQVFAAPFKLETISLRIDASIGVAITPDHGTDHATLLKHADVAMYAAKTIRGSAVRSYDKIQESSSGRTLEIIGELRAAIENSTIDVAYQPKADLITGDVAGVEALARWTHPRLGSIGPNEFIPLAEQAGLIADLTTTILRRSLAACAQWHAMGYPISVAVNIDAQTLLTPNFAQHVLTELRNANLPAQALTLEITERELVRELNDAADVINELRTIGIIFSIDDFGTGYSSLGYLTRLPIDEIKIDRSFIVTITNSPQHSAIVKAIADIAHSLHLTTVVEGIEDPETWATVANLGCTYGQGYYLARPMPHTQLLEWLSLHQTPKVTPPTRNIGLSV